MISSIVTPTGVLSRRPSDASLPTPSRSGPWSIVSGLSPSPASSRESSGADPIASASMRDGSSSQARNLAFGLKKFVWSAGSCASRCFGGYKQVKKRDTLSLIEARRNYVTGFNRNLRGGPYHPNSCTLSKLKRSLPDIRKNIMVDASEPSKIFDQLYAAVVSKSLRKDSSSCDDSEDWAVAKTILKHCPDNALQGAFSVANQEKVARFFLAVFSSVEASVRTEKLPPAYRLKDQKYKHNDPSWDPSDEELVRKLIRCIDEATFKTLESTKSYYGERSSVLKQMQRQASVYSENTQSTQSTESNSSSQWDSARSLEFVLSERILQLSPAASQKSATPS